VWETQKENLLKIGLSSALWNSFRSTKSNAARHYDDRNIFVNKYGDDYDDVIISLPSNLRFRSGFEGKSFTNNLSEKRTETFQTTTTTTTTTTKPPCQYIQLQQLFTRDDTNWHEHRPHACTRVSIGTKLEKLNKQELNRGNLNTHANTREHTRTHAHANEGAFRTFLQGQVHEQKGDKSRRV